MKVRKERRMGVGMSRDELIRGLVRIGEKEMTGEDPAEVDAYFAGVDVIPFEDGLVKRKDVYSDSVSILRQVGLLDG
jgi:hypothetical protein